MAIEGSLYILLPQSKNAQRLGSLVALSKLASASRATSLQELTRNYRKAITSPITVPDAMRADIISFLRKRNLARKYKIDAPQLVIESQDWLLAADDIPSRTGSEKEEVAGTIDLATQVGLLWPTNYQRTWAGDLIVAKSGDIINAFATGDRTRNPYELSVYQRTIFAYLLFETDRTFLAFLVGLLLKIPEPIGINALIEELEVKFSGFVKSMWDIVKTSDDRVTIKALDKLSMQMRRKAQASTPQGHTGITRQTVRRSYEELLYCRLEALVDLQYLKKPDPDTYSYNCTPGLRDLMTLLEGTGGDGFFQHWWRCLGYVPEVVDMPRTRSLMLAANQAKSNSMGYTLIREGTLVANLLALEKQSQEVVELSTATEAIKAGTDEHIKVVVSVDRNRNLTAYKMTAIS